MLPPDFFTMPTRVFSVVVLPAPLAPISHQLALFDVKIDALDRLNATIGHLQVFDFQNAHACAAPR